MITECGWFRSLTSGSVSSLSVGTGRFGPWLSCSRWWIVTLHVRPRPMSCHLPNKRLKLSGARVGRIAFPRWLAFVSAAPPPCARGHVARSLSAIR